MLGTTWGASTEEQMLAHRWQLMLGAHLALALAVPGQTAELNPASLFYQLPDQIRLSSPSAAGAQNSVLVAEPHNSGHYAVHNTCPKRNHFNRPEFHATDRFM